MCLKPSSNPPGPDFLRALPQKVLVCHARDEVSHDLCMGGIVLVFIGHAIEIIRKDDRGIIALVKIFEITFKQHLKNAPDLPCFRFYFRIEIYLIQVEFSESFQGL